MNVPTIAHADVSINERGRVVIKMNEGYSFYDKAAYTQETQPEDITYSKYGVFSPDTDFDSRFVVAADEEISDTATAADVPANQIN